MMEAVALLSALAIGIAIGVLAGGVYAVVHLRDRIAESVKLNAEIARKTDALNRARDSYIGYARFDRGDRERSKVIN